MQFRVLVIILTMFAFLPGGQLPGGGFDPAVDQAFDRYYKQREVAIWSELNRVEGDLWIDRLPVVQRQSQYEALRAGQVVLDEHRMQKIEKGIIHHATGAVFLPGVGVDQLLGYLQDFDHLVPCYTPELVSSRTRARQGDRYLITQRYRKKKVLTVILDTDHEVNYVYFNGRPGKRAASFGYATRIEEVANAGTPREKRLGREQSGGYVWRMNNYWRYFERDGGVYVQCETISLSRSIPTGLEWMIGRFINSVPRESLQFTLDRTRQCGRRLGR